MESLRENELQKLSYSSTLYFENSTSTILTTDLWFSLRHDVYHQAALSLGLITFLVFLLAIATIYFSKDSHELIVNPIERMLFIVRKLFQSQMKKVANVDMRELKRKSLMEKSATKTNFCLKYCCPGNQEVDNMDPELGSESKENVKLQSEASSSLRFETVMLEKTIVKLGYLLHMGCGGDRGAKIITKHMSGDIISTSSGGTRVLSYLFSSKLCKATIIWQVAPHLSMKLLNEIAAILHNSIGIGNGRIVSMNDDIFTVCFKLGVEAESSASANQSKISKFSNVDSFGVSEITAMKYMPTENKLREIIDIDLEGFSFLSVSIPILHPKFTLLQNGLTIDTIIPVHSVRKPIVSMGAVSYTPSGTGKIADNPFSKNLLKTAVPDAIVSLVQKATMADNVLASAIQTFLTIRSPKLFYIRDELRVLTNLPDFEINMNFGLHGGHAFECVSGSEHKLRVAVFAANHTNNLWYSLFLILVS